MTSFIIFDSCLDQLFMEVTDINVIEILLHNFCNYIADLHGKEIRVLKDSLLLCKVFQNGTSLAALLYDLDSPLSKRLRRRLSIAIDRSLVWDIDENNRVVEAISMERERILNINITYGFQLASQHRPPSFITLGLPGAPLGWQELCRDSDGVTKKLHFSPTEERAQEYFRGYIVESNATPEEFFRLRSLAFPKTIFNDLLLNRFNSFSHSYDSLRESIVTSISILNDHFISIHQTEKGETHKIGSIMSSRYKIDCSPESPKTHKNAVAMKLRNVSINGKVYPCEWHVKLFPHIDRIHFFPDFSQSVIIIGIFTDHLPT